MQALMDDQSAVAEGVEIVSGTVRWFNPAKGYGFIIPDDETRDIMLHLKVLRRGGYKEIGQGARITCERAKTPQGPQAVGVLELDNSTARTSVPLPKLRQRATATSGWVRATVKWFNRLRGFGFVTCGEGTPDIFVHMETIRHCNMTELQPNQVVWVECGLGDKGLVATGLRPEGWHPPAQ